MPRVHLAAEVDPQRIGILARAKRGFVRGDGRGIGWVEGDGDGTNATHSLSATWALDMLTIAGSHPPFRAWSLVGPTLTGKPAGVYPYVPAADGVVHVVDAIGAVVIAPMLVRFIGGNPGSGSSAGNVPGPLDLTVNEGATATFVVYSFGFVSPTYQWQSFIGSWNNIGGATSSSYAHAATAPENGRQYRCIVSDSRGPVTSRAATLTVQSAPAVNSVSVSPSDPSVRWYDQQVTLTANITEGSPVSTKAWYRNNVLLPGETGSTYLPPIGWSEDGADYKCVATNIAGSSNASSGAVSLAARAGYQGPNTTITSANWILSPIFATVNESPNITPPHPAMARVSKTVSGRDVGALQVPAGLDGKTVLISPSIRWVQTGLSGGQWRGRLMIDRAAGGTETLLDRTAGATGNDLFYEIWRYSGDFGPIGVGGTVYAETTLHVGDIIYAVAEVVSWSVAPTSLTALGGTPGSGITSLDITKVSP